MIGDPSRGIYMQSPYYHNRYYDYSSDGNDELGPAPWMLAAESDLVRAEALIRSNGSLATAATLINNTRVTRGSLTPATAADGAAKLLGYIDYERDVELLSTNGYTLFQRRHVDGLQKGTILQLPIPAKELETLALPIYTFGGVGGTSAAAFIGAVAPKALYAGSTVANLETTSGKVLQLHLPTAKRTARGSKM